MVALRVRWSLCCVLLLLTVSVVPAATALVTYVAGSSIYIDVGSSAGLAVGDTIELIEGDTVIATLEVTELSSRRAACRVIESSRAIRIGDQARFTPKEVQADEPSESAEKSETKKKSRRRSSNWNGRVGVRYWYSDEGLSGSRVTQPAFDFRVDGHDIGGAPLDLSIDTRSRRTTRKTASSSTSDSISRVYQARVGWNPGRSGWAVAAGRQISPEFASVSIYDGVSVHYRKPAWSTGVFYGTQPKAEDFGFGGPISEYGAYVRRQRAVRGKNFWALTFGVVTSEEDSEFNREYAFLRARVSSKRWTAVLTQEVDHNKDWKAAVESSTWDPTGTFVYARFKASDRVTLRAGYDDRRRVRLWRDRLTPETEFDDANRTGFRLGTDLKLTKRMGLSLSARQRDGGNNGASDSITSTFRIRNLGSRNLSVTQRLTKYTNDDLDGLLASAYVGANLGARLHLEVGGGIRDESSARAMALTDSVVWFGFDMDVDLGRRWYATWSVERSDGDFEELTQSYLSLSVRF